MCYHYGLSKDKKAVEKRFQATPAKQLPLPFFHVSAFEEKAQYLPVITDAQPDSIQGFSWGLLPSWSQQQTLTYQTQNAKSEELLDKPAFRKVFQKRHCIIPSDGFYEWQHFGQQKTPFFISLKGVPIFSFAGLWDAWEDSASGTQIHSFTLLTTAANSLMAEIHNTKKRMPLILLPEDEKRWLTTPLSSSTWERIRKGLPSELLQATPANHRLLQLPDGPEKRTNNGFQTRLF